MHRLLILICLLMVSICGGQSTNRKVMSGEEVERLWRDQQELGDIYQRAAASRFVIVGTVSNRELIGTRGKPSGIDENLAGTLYTVDVENTICKQEDFPLELKPAASHVSRSVQMFVPVKPYFEGTQRKESLSEGSRYLLFLTQPDGKQQDTWTKSFVLDPSRTYYRGEEFARGVIALPKPTDNDPSPKQTAVLSKLVQLCGAMAKKGQSDKISALNVLAASPDPILKKEAQEALRAVQLSAR